MNSLYTNVDYSIAQNSAQFLPKIQPARSFSAMLATQGDQPSPQSATGSSSSQPSSLVHLGSISKDKPTISHLLINHPEYKSRCWSIVHDPINQDKPFRSLLPDQDVWLDPRTLELVLDKETRQPNQDRTAGMGASQSENLYTAPKADTSLTGQELASGLNHAQEQNKPDRFAQPPNSLLAPAFSFASPTLENQPGATTTTTMALSQAVAAYRGQPYSSLDCYELVVQGLKDMGIQYSGRQGLQKALITQARANNLPLNAYLTGEGLIDSLGRSVAQQTIMPAPANIGQQTQDLLTDLQGHLEPGLILSFSTQYHGHTGVISVHQDQWTFINSGRIDNSVHPGENGKQVGEEDLFQELKNWLQKAADNKTHLQVTLGRLEQEKLASFSKPIHEQA